MSRTFHHGKHSKHWRWNMPRPYGQTPSWFVREFMNRPKRAQDRQTIRRVLSGRLDFDDVIFNLGNRKPHVYFW